MPGYIYQISTSISNDFTASQIVRALRFDLPEYEAPRFGVRSAAAPLHILSPEVFSPFDLFFLPFFLNLLVDSVPLSYLFSKPTDETKAGWPRGGFTADRARQR